MHENTKSLRTAFLGISTNNFFYTKLYVVDKINLTNVKPSLISIGWRV